MILSYFFWSLSIFRLSSFWRATSISLIQSRTRALNTADRKRTNEFMHFKKSLQHRILFQFLFQILQRKEFHCSLYQTWDPTWTVSNFVFTLTASFTLGCSHSSLKGLGDFSEDPKCGFLLHGCFPVLNHFVCDFDCLWSLLRFLWSLLTLIILFIVVTGLLI